MLEAIMTFLSAASSVLANRGQESLSDYLALAVTLIREGEGAREELDALAAQIQAMVDANRDPTTEEWAAVKARRDELSQRIQANAPVSDAPAG